MAIRKFEKWLEPDNLILLTGWARSGLTEEQIAHNMGIRRETLYSWKKTYPEINNAVSQGKAVADYIVENAMYKSACGYDVIEYEDKIDAFGKIRRCEKKKHIPANITAQIFWLKNRMPAEWREKREVQVEEKHEDDGLMAALLADDFEMCDDTDMIVDDEEDVTEE